MDQILATGGSVTLIHYTHAVGGNWRIACMPNMVEFHVTLYHPNYQRSDDVRAVSCPACKKTAAFTGAQDALTAALRGPARAR